MGGLRWRTRSTLLYSSRAPKFGTSGAHKTLRSIWYGAAALAIALALLGGEILAWRRDDDTHFRFQLLKPLDMVRMWGDPVPEQSESRGGDWRGARGCDQAFRPRRAHARQIFQRDADSG